MGLLIAIDFGRALEQNFQQAHFIGWSEILCGFWEFLEMGSEGVWVSVHKQ